VPLLLLQQDGHCINGQTKERPEQHLYTTKLLQASRLHTHGHLVVVFLEQVELWHSRVSTRVILLYAQFSGEMHRPLLIKHRALRLVLQMHCWYLSAAAMSRYIHAS